MRLGRLPGYSVAILSSVTLHGLLLVIVIVGWTPERKNVAIRPQYIQATLLQVKPPEAPVTKKQTTKPKPADNKQQKVAEKKRAEAKKIEEQKRQIRLREEKKLAEQRAKEERLTQEREKAKAQKDKQAEALRREQELAFASALNEEEEYISAAADEQLVGSYSDYVAGEIVKKWSRPPSARRDMKVSLSIQLVPTGRVVSVAVEKSSGNSAFDRSAEQAVYKVERFEKLQELSKANPRVFESTFRRFRLTFTPDDLRL